MKADHGKVWNEIMMLSFWIVGSWKLDLPWYWALLPIWLFLGLVFAGAFAITLRGGRS